MLQAQSRRQGCTFGSRATANRLDPGVEARILVGEHIAGLALRRRRGPSEDLAKADEEDFDLFVGGISRS